MKEEMIFFYLCKRKDLVGKLGFFYLNFYQWLFCFYKRVRGVFRREGVRSGGALEVKKYP